MEINVYPEHLQKYIPPDFDLAKYDKAANMDLLHWIHNLNKRCDLNVDVKQDEIAANINVGICTDILLTEALIKDSIIGDRAEYVSLVRELTCYEVLDKGEELNNDADLNALFKKVQNENDTNPRTFQKTLGKLNNVLAANGINEDGSYSAWLEVDLACSDSEITEAFSSWLKRTRERTKNRINKPKRREYKLNKFNKVAFRKWHDAKVIPYLDLVTWNLLEGNKVTSKILGDILFPNPKDRNDPTAVINDTVKPLADKLTSDNTMNRMYKFFVDTTRKKMSLKSSKAVFSFDHVK